MTHPHIPLEFSGSDVASRRAAAVSAFIATAHRLLPDPEAASPEALKAVAQALEQLGLQRELFPAEHFPVSADNPAQVYRLSEDLGGRYALYVSAGLPGKAQPPHDHTTWAMIAGIAGVERNVFYRREATADAARDALILDKTVDVEAGVSVVLSPRMSTQLNWLGMSLACICIFMAAGWIACLGVWYSRAPQAAHTVPLHLPSPFSIP